MKNLVERFYRELWEEARRESLAEICHADFNFRGSLGIYKRGHDGFWEYLKLVRGALPEFHCEIESLVEEGDEAFAQMCFRGLHQGELLGFAPTGKEVTWYGAALFTFRGGKIADVWVLGDVHGLRQQLEDQMAVA